MNQVTYKRFLRYTLLAAVSLLLASIFLLILLEISHAFGNDNAKWQLTDNANAQTIIIQGSIFIIALWGLVYLITLNSLIALAAISDVKARIIDYLSRILAAIPTVFIAGTIVVTVDQITPISCAPLWWQLCIIFVAACVSALPTVVQTTYPVIKEFTKTDGLAGRTLGFDRMFIIAKIIKPRFSRPHLASVSIAISRVVVESAIILGGVIGQQKLEDKISQSKDIAELLASSYNAVSIQSNIYLILALVIMAMFSRVWSMGFATIGKA